MNKEVSINDFIMPEFREAKPENYERRSDGKIVRKDRWETGIRNIATITGIHEFEVKQIVERVRQLVSHELASWKKINYEDTSTLPTEGSLCLVDWDCFEYAAMLPQVLIWGRDENVLMWLDTDLKVWAGLGLEMPNPTHFKYIGKRPERIVNDN